MLSDALSDAPRTALPSPVNLQEFLEAAAARQAAERLDAEQRERRSVVWVAGLAGNAKRNSLGSVTTKRLSEKRSSLTVASPAAAASKDEDPIGSLLRHLKLADEKPSPRTAVGRRGSRNQAPGSPVKRLSQHQSAPIGKRPSLVLSSEGATDYAASASTPPVHPLVSPGAVIPPLISPTGVGSPSRRRRSIPPRAPAGASHALPSVEHLRAIPFSRPTVVPLVATVPSPLASPAHQSLAVAPTLLSPIAAPPSPTTRRSSMPCQSATGPMQRFWADTRQAEFNGRRNSGSKPLAVEDRKESGSETSPQQQQSEEVVEVVVKPVKQVRWRDDVEYEGRPRANTTDAVVKTAADPNYSWLPIGTSLRVEP